MWSTLEPWDDRTSSSSEPRRRGRRRCTRRSPGTRALPVARQGAEVLLCDGRPPLRRDHRGPGDAHSRREWVWNRDRYERLFDGAPPGTLKGESTPFYLYDRQAHARIAADVPHARLVAVIRDPVDRAYSNWMHLRSDGLEPVPDFLDALALEPRRRAQGFAPMWHYRGLGLYGSQLRSLYEHFPREQVHVLRYRELVDSPEQTLADVARFLGVPERVTPPATPENVKPFVPASPRNDRLRAVVRAGAWAGQWVPPQVWRRVEGRLLPRLYAGGTSRPRLTPEQRSQAVGLFASDVELLENLLGRPFRDWVEGDGRGSFVDLTQTDRANRPAS